MRLLLLISMVQISVFAMRPVPWFTEGAIEYLEQFFEENDNPKVLEFGSGSSTVWMAKRTVNLISVEHHADWHNDVVKAIDVDPTCNKAQCHLRDRPYNNICEEFDDESFDLIIVDGRDRAKCIVSAISKLKPGGVLMLDNSERFRYHTAFPLMDGWEGDKHEQKMPDSCGFMYGGWETRWWIKPVSY